MATPLKAAYDTSDAIPEEVADFYTENAAGVYQLAVEPTSGFELANAANLKGALQKERGLRDRAEKALKVFDGLDPAEARSAMEKLSEIGDGLGEDQAEKLEALQNQLQLKFEGERKKIVEKFDSERNQLASQLDSVTGQLSRELINSTAATAISKAGGSVDLLLPVLEARTRVRQRDDGQFVVEVPDRDGNARLSTASGSMDSMSIHELVSELREDKSFSRAFDPINAAGSGASASASSGAGGKFTISKEDARDTTKYRAAREAAHKAGRELTIK